jgi:hypothetical protein
LNKIKKNQLSHFKVSRFTYFGLLEFWLTSQLSEKKSDIASEHDGALLHIHREMKMEAASLGGLAWAGPFLSHHILQISLQISISSFGTI